MLRISKLVIVFIFALNQVTSDAPQKVLLTVFYESKCSDSKDFTLQQLQPTIHLLHEYVQLKLVCFGKAKSINGGYDGFQCQHGPTECAGNLVQSCALDIMQKRCDVEKVSYVACEMETQAGTRGDMECVIKAGLQPDEVKECVSSKKGVSLQLRDEHDTKTVRPKIKFIPTITIDGVYNQQIQDSALKDLTGTLCSLPKLRGTPPCSQHYNTQAYVLL